MCASLLAKSAKAHFVKTSTGFSKGGATVFDVALMREAVGPTIGVKASGGIRSAEHAEQTIAAGARGIGASAGVEAMAGLFGGLQSLHTDAYDEVLSTPIEEAARVAVATQNILRDEAHLADVIDPLGGAYYVESLTDRMEAEIESVIGRIEAAGGMYQAVESGLVQAMIGDSALAFQERVESGAQKIVGVNAYRVEEDKSSRAPLERPDPARMEAQIARLKRFKAERSQAAVDRALAALAAAAADEKTNVFEQVVEAAVAGATHGEIVARLRREMGFGEPLVIA